MASGKVIYATYTLAHTLVLAWAGMLFIQAPSLNLVILLAVLIGLIYDNFIIFLGDQLQEGGLLESLNKLRYWFHGLFSPLLLIFAVQVLHFAHLSWDHTFISNSVAWMLTLSLILIEVITRMSKLKLKPVTFAGTLRYKEVIPSKEIPVILVILLVGLIGFSIWQQLQWAWMFWGALVMLLGSAVPTSTKAGPSIGSGVEVLFGLSLVFTQAMLLRSV